MRTKFQGFTIHDTHENLPPCHLTTTTYTVYDTQQYESVHMISDDDIPSPPGSCRVSSCSARVACSSCCLQTLRSCGGAGRVLTQLRRHGKQRRQTPGLTRAPLTSADHALAVVSLQMEMVICTHNMWDIVAVS